MGYSFFDDHIYYPERLVELNRSGELISAVAVTEDNVFMGHAGLLYQNPGRPHRRTDLCLCERGVPRTGSP
jgi:hypothetical protein